MKLILVTLALATNLNAFAASPADNKRTVVSFYEMAFRDHKPEQAANMFIGDPYIQHNPHVPDGKKPFVEYFVPYFKAHPEARSDIKRAVAENDLVVLHVLSRQNLKDRGRAVVDIFRVENGKIVEHWDVMQEVPAKSANQNSMF